MKLTKAHVDFLSAKRAPAFARQVTSIHRQGISIDQLVNEHADLKETDYERGASATLQTVRLRQQRGLNTLDALRGLSDSKSDNRRVARAKRWIDTIAERNGVNLHDLADQGKEHVTAVKFWVKHRLRATAAPIDLDLRSIESVEAVLKLLCLHQVKDEALPINISLETFDGKRHDAAYMARNADHPLHEKPDVRLIFDAAGIKIR